MSEQERIGAIVRARREKLGLTLASLASRVGVTPQAIQKIETGKSRLTGKRALVLAEELGLQPHQLFHQGLREDRLNFVRTRREAELFLDAALLFSRIRSKSRRAEILKYVRQMAETEATESQQDQGL